MRFRAPFSLLISTCFNCLSSRLLHFPAHFRFGYSISLWQWFCETINCSAWTFKPRVENLPSIRFDKHLIQLVNLFHWLCCEWWDNTVFENIYEQFGNKFYRKTIIKYALKSVCERETTVRTPFHKSICMSLVIIEQVTLLNVTHTNVFDLFYTFVSISLRFLAKYRERKVRLNLWELNKTRFKHFYLTFWMHCVIFISN